MDGDVAASVDAGSLADWLHDGREIALLDVREHGQFGESHLFHGIPLPYSRLELEIARLVPRRATRVVVYDDGLLGVAQRAAQRLAALGYRNVWVLEDGTAGWKRAGYRLFAGVNVPSKAFGELAEHHYRTPRLQPAQVAAMLASGQDLVLLDGRPFAEYRKMTIPGSLCCPNGELVYRAGAIVADARTPIVVNCAGRTRSIIGAQTLINFGIPNPVYALENGTQGWSLEGMALEHGASRRYPDAPQGIDIAALRARAKALAERQGVRFVGDDEVEAWLADESRTTYLCDVRTPEEFAAATLPGAASAPGGQLLQATDQWIAVRNARVVLVDQEGVRAPVIAGWLLQMGHDACVLRGGTASRVRAALQAVPLPEIALVTAAELADMLDAKAASVVDLRPSMAYRKSHIAGSLWSIRPRLDGLRERLVGRVVLVADEPGIARIAAQDLARSGTTRVAMLAGGFAAWEAAGRSVEATPDRPLDDECVDFLFFVHDRHDGNKEAARRYLAWETGLVSQLDARELASFRFRGHDAAD